MSEIDFEALGRCEHVKGLISKAVRDRDLAFSHIASSYRKADHREIHDSVKFMDIEKMHGFIADLEKANTELTALVDEYNKWCEAAGKRPIKFVAY
ncbi:hypothetical protein ACSMDC_09610 [Yersinia enterocolitica]|uniref:hypothetical protein n=1 Tax=Yersinia enterocolitica TaxID=630 RepID=UPI003F52168A